MNKTQYLPTLLIAINILSALMYGADGDWRKVVYWLSAAALTAAITF